MKKIKKFTDIVFVLNLSLLLLTLPININATCTLECGQVDQACGDGFDCSVDADTHILTCNGEKINCDGPVGEQEVIIA